MEWDTEMPLATLEHRFHYADPAWTYVEVAIHAATLRGLLERMTL